MKTGSMADKSRTRQEVEDRNNAVSICQDGSRFYLSFTNRGTRSRRDFATVKGAIRHCESQGYVVDMDDLPNPNAESVARMIMVWADGSLSFNEGGAYIKAESLESLNHVLKKMGYKPVRVTANHITGNGKRFVIDADTPACCDPGTETYHSM
jgi:hypothetical protein